MSSLLTFLPVSDDLGKQILKGVSRSFYLTLRLLPAPMRDAASLGYLLARTSDTIADTETISAADRLDLLEDYSAAVDHGSAVPPWPAALLEGAESKERRLLERSAEILRWLANTPADEGRIIREVLQIIISGQSLDLLRFANADVTNPIALPDADTLEDYTWRVAGCVGAFWTKLGFLALGETYSKERKEVLLEKGISYGKGLQLVNILRDLPRDLGVGRCYLPIGDSSDVAEIMGAFRKWHRQALRWVSEGKEYAATLPSRRLRAATVLPALIAEETLDLLDGVSWETLQTRVKIPRRRIHRLLAESLLF